MNSQQFSAQYMPYSRKLFAIAFRIVRRTDVAEDVVQEVLLRTWQMRDTMPPAGPEAEARLVTMTKNLSIDQLRTRHSAEDEAMVLNGTSDSWTPPDEPDNSVQEQIEQRDQLQQTLRLMKQLPEVQQMILRLRLIDDMEFSDIAHATGLTEVNVRVQLTRARQQLKSLALKHHIL